MFAVFLRKLPLSKIHGATPSTTFRPCQASADISRVKYQFNLGLVCVKGIDASNWYLSSTFIACQLLEILGMMYISFHRVAPYKLPYSKAIAT